MLAPLAHATLGGAQVEAPRITGVDRELHDEIAAGLRDAVPALAPVTAAVEPTTTRAGIYHARLAGAGLDHVNVAIEVDAVVPALAPVRADGHAADLHSR